MSLYTLHDKKQIRGLFYMKSKAWNYIWMKTPVDQQPPNDILWGLKALCGSTLWVEFLDHDLL